MLFPVRRASSVIGLLWQLVKSYRLGATVVVAGVLVLTTTCVLQFDGSPVGRASREFFGI